MVVQDLDRRFGGMAVDRGFITSKQLIDAITIQAKENVEESKHRLIGTILFENGFMSMEQINEVLGLLPDNDKTSK